MRQQVVYLTGKRILDVIAAALGLALLLPLGLLIAVLTKLADGGPVFFAQTRVGQGGKSFHMWKFRSMVVGAEKLGPQLTRGNDARITPLGKFLRRTKLDELPQLWNVLVGEMSLVGPRPEVPRYVQQYTAQQREVLRYKPGITDPASLVFRNEEAILQGSANVEQFYLQYCVPRKIELNRQHAQQASLMRDIWVVLRTVFPNWMGTLIIYGVALMAAFHLSCQLCYDFRVPRHSYIELQRALPWVVVPQLLALIWLARLRATISFFSLPELRRLSAALGTALLLQFAIPLLSGGELALPSNIIVLDAILSLAILCGVRISFRVWRERRSQIRRRTAGPARRVAIVGPSETSARLALEMDGDRSDTATVVALFDDDPRSWHQRPHDIPVIGMPECLLNPAWASRIDEVIVALPRRESARMRELAAMLQHVAFKVTLAEG